MNNEVTYIVKNRSAGMVVYNIPEENIRREFAPGETKKISANELEKLTFQSGGRELIANYLLVSNDEVLQELGMKPEPEYYMTEEQIIDLINNGSLDAWLDCLDFAPVGVLDLVKKLSTSIPLNDLHKIEALKEKTGFDVSAALLHIKEENQTENKIEPATERRVKTEEPVAEGRRTTPKYKVINNPAAE